MKECPSGQKLSDNNGLIVKCITDLKVQQQEMRVLLKKQEEERERLQAEMERIAYKLLLVCFHTNTPKKIIIIIPFNT